MEHILLHTLQFIEDKRKFLIDTNLLRQFVSSDFTYAIQSNNKVMIIRILISGFLPNKKQFKSLAKYDLLFYNSLKFHNNPNYRNYFYKYNYTSSYIFNHTDPCKRKYYLEVVFKYIVKEDNFFLLLKFIHYCNTMKIDVKIDVDLIIERGKYHVTRYLIDNNFLSNNEIIRIFMYIEAGALYNYILSTGIVDDYIRQIDNYELYTHTPSFGKFDEKLIYCPNILKMCLSRDQLINLSFYLQYFIQTNDRRLIGYFRNINFYTYENTRYETILSLISTNLKPGDVDSYLYSLKQISCNQTCCIRIFKNVYYMMKNIDISSVFEYACMGVSIKIIKFILLRHDVKIEVLDFYNQNVKNYLNHVIKLKKRYGIFYKRLKYSLL